MTDHRQCGRCGRTDAIPGTAIDAPHNCPHGVRCEVNGCTPCAAMRRELRQRVLDSLPGARVAFGLERP